MAKYYKLIIWHAVILLLSWKFWGYVSYLLKNSKTLSFDFEPAAVANLVVILTLVGLGFVLFQSRWLILSLGVVSNVFFLSYMGITKLNLIGMGLSFLLLLYAWNNIITEIKGRIRLSISTILKSGLTGIILATFILISFGAYQSTLAKDIEKSRKLPSASQSFISSIVKNVVGKQIQTSNQTEKQNIINQVSQQTFNEINNFFGPYFKYAPPILAFGLFLILWGLSWIFVWLSVLLGMLIFWILKKIGVVRTEEKDVKAEVLII